VGPRADNISQAVEAHSVVRRRGPHIFLYSRLTDGGEVVSLTRRPPFTPRKIFVLISVRGYVDSRAIVRMERLSQLKNTMSSSGIVPSPSSL
jgi:hypothetical protein